MFDYGGVIDRFPDDITLLIMDMRRKGIVVGLISNVSLDLARTTRQSGGYTQFDITVLSGEVGLRKPDIDMYRLALNQLDNTPPHDVLVIDDNPANLAVATTLGVQTVCFRDINSVAAIRMVVELHSRADV